MRKPPERYVKLARPFLSGERETFATVLLGILLQPYGAELLDWDPLTIEAQVVEDFDVHMPQLVYDQLMGLITGIASDAVYRNVEAFDETVNALNRAGVGNDQDMPSAEDVAWTVFELMINDPDPFGQGVGVAPYSPDIGRYVGVVLADEGIRRPPETLSFAVMPPWAPDDLVDHPGEFEAAWKSQVASGEDIDRHVQKLAAILIEHLTELGIEPAPLLQERADDLPEANPLDQLLPR